MPLQEVNIPRNSKPVRRAPLCDHNKENFPLNPDKPKAELPSPRPTHKLAPQSPKRALQEPNDGVVRSPRAAPVSPKPAAKKKEMEPTVGVTRRRAGSYPLANCDMKPPARKSWPEAPLTPVRQDKPVAMKCKPRQRIEILQTGPIGSPRPQQPSPRPQRPQRSPTPQTLLAETHKRSKRSDKKEEGKGSKLLKQLKDVKQAGVFDFAPLRKRKDGDDAKRRRPLSAGDADEVCVASDPVPTVAYPNPEPEITVAVSAPVKPEEDVEYIFTWLKGQQEIVARLIPVHLRQQNGAEGHCHSEEMEGEEQNTKPIGSLINTKYLKQLFTYFDICRNHMHLPSLNLFFSFFETLLLVGHKKHMNLLLNKTNLPRLIECMQFDPKLNSKISERKPHLQVVARRNTAVELPPGLAELATTCYLLQYCKETVFPVVCDEARYMAFNQHWQKMKTKLTEAIIRDPKLLATVFGKLQNPGTPDDVAHHLRFLRELIDLAVSHYQWPEEFWQMMMEQYDLTGHLVTALGSPHINVRRAAVDIGQLLCDEEARKALQFQIIKRPQFLQKAFELYLADNRSEEGTILQLQAVLPMLVATPEPTVLPIFYDAANIVLTHWNRGLSRGTTPNHTHLCSFVELMSLCVHHHRLTCNYTSNQVVTQLITLCSELWLGLPHRHLPTNVLIALNKVILTVLHLHNPIFHELLVQKQLFKGILRMFTEKNNMVNSSILTLLHTILQLEISVLVSHITEMWFSKPAASPDLKGVSFVQHLFHERYTRQQSFLAL